MKKNITITKKNITIDKIELKKYLELSTDDLLKYLKLEFNKDRYIYINNNSKVLGIAHLDVVGGDKKLSSIFYNPLNNKNQKMDLIYSKSLDDRLGVFILLNILPKLGIKIDILLTTDEEIFQSSARKFKPIKKYNWLVEFDRAGDDVVLYDYESTKLINILKKYFKIGIGSYSDICELYHLGISGFNIGIGYQNAHTFKCYADLNITKKQLRRFLTFYNYYKNKKIPLYKNSNFYLYNFDNFELTESIEYCDLCDNDNGLWREDLTLYLCDNCYNRNYKHIHDIYYGKD